MPSDSSDVWSYPCDFILQRDPIVEVRLFFLSVELGPCCHWNCNGTRKAGPELSLISPVTWNALSDVTISSLKWINQARCPQLLRFLQSITLCWHSFFASVDILIEPTECTPLDLVICLCHRHSDLIISNRSWMLWQQESTEVLST